jgi:hypothetical protein
MHEVLIDEPLRKVYALFEVGKIKPIALEWGQKRWRVERVNSHWVDRSLRPHRYGFSLTMETGEIFQVTYEEGNPVWRLDCILRD